MNILRLLLAVSLKPTDIGLPNSTANVGQIITNAIQFLMGIIGLASVAFIIFGGFKITTSAGDPAKYKSGRETLTYAIIGLVVAIAAYAIVSFISSRIG
jgi:hypothetical protein